nr:DUF2155 domain-containing protein [Govania unica]
MTGVRQTVAALLFAAVAMPAWAADPQAVATLNALDKITGRVSELKAHVGQPVRFGALEITLRDCQSAPPEDAPETKAFLEIRDIKPNSTAKQVFAGWMFASSPALNALEHPVYDVWVIACSAIAPATHDRAPPAAVASPETPADTPDTPDEDTDSGNAEKIPLD